MTTRWLLGACTALALLLLAHPPGARASGGTFTQILCADPDTGRGVVGSDGAFPASMRAWKVDDWGFTWAQSRTRCSGTMAGDRGILLDSGGHTRTVPGADQGLILRYEAERGVRFERGEVFRQSRMGGAWEDYWRLGINRRSGRGAWGQPAYDNCTSRWSENCRSRGSSTPSAPETTPRTRTPWSPRSWLALRSQANARTRRILTGGTETVPRRAPGSRASRCRGRLASRSS